MKKLICPKIKILQTKFLKTMFVKFIVIAMTVLLLGCSKNKHETLILWTDNVEFASYAELFNATQPEAKIGVVYKSNLIENLPVKKGEQKPDIIVGSYISSDMQKHFSSIDKVFTDNLVPEDFYSSLLEAGKKGKTQYLLPVSFNLGTFVYDVNYSDLIENNPTTLTVEQIQEYSKKFNAQSKDKIYTKMAFAPQWNPDFLYLILRTNDLIFTLDGDKIKFNLPILENVCNSLTNWTNTINTSSNEERNFAFKYLYTPFNKQVLQQKSLFAFSSSKQLLALSEDQLEKINFCWFSCDNQSPVAEDMTMIGLYKKSSNKKDAIKFIQWFFTEDSQEAMLKRKILMNLDTNTFGIANGFSSLTSVNERVLPVYYKCLLAKIPSNNFPKAPNAYPPQWKQVKKEIIIPYLLDDVAGKKDIQSISKHYAEWIKQNKEE